MTRSFVFNGQSYRVGLPVTTTVDFTTYSFGYRVRLPALPARLCRRRRQSEVHQCRRRPREPDRLGIHLRQTAPIPGIQLRRPRLCDAGFSIEAELSFFRIPDSISEQLEGDGSYTDFDLHAHLQLQQVCRRPAGMAEHQDLLRRRPRYRRPAVQRALLRRSGSVLARSALRASRYGLTGLSAVSGPDTSASCRSAC